MNNNFEDIISGWKAQPQKLAKELREKYGDPDCICRELMIWYSNGPWKRTILRNEELKHKFPKPHEDSLENIIDYRVPPEKATELAEFDGSVLFDRTKGEMSARCDKEAANFLALNLANDVVNNSKTVAEAREEYGRQIMAMMQGKEASYTEGLKFEIRAGGIMDTADPDETTIQM